MARAKRLPEGVSTNPSRRDGTVTYEARWRDKGGKRHSATFATVDEAAAHLADQRESLRRGGTADPTGGRVLLGDWLDSWWQGRLDRREVAQSTAAMHRSYIASQIKPNLGHWRIGDLTAADIERWTSGLIASGRAAPATAVKAQQIVSMSLDRAVRDHLILANPCLSARPPRIPRSEARFCTIEEVDAIEQAFDPWWQLLIPTLVDTAMRIGEAAAVLVMDVSVEVCIGGRTRRVDLLDAARTPEAITGGTVRVRRGATEVPLDISGADERRQVGGPKTDAGWRYVPTLTAGTTRRLVAQVEQRRQQLSDELFQGRHGAPLNAHNLRERAWGPALEAAGVVEPLPTWHSLRHTGISEWLEAGVSPHRAARYAGHSDSELLRLYGHLMEHDAVPAREALERMRSEKLRNR